MCVYFTCVCGVLIAAKLQSGEKIKTQPVCSLQDTHKSLHDMVSMCRMQQLKGINAKFNWNTQIGNYTGVNLGQKVCIFIPLAVLAWRIKNS